MEYIIIENFNGEISLVTDEEAKVIKFKSKEEALVVKEELHDGTIVPLKEYNGR